MKYITHSKVTFLFLLGLLISSALPGESIAQPEEKTLLWKIEGNDIKPSYLLGTIHLMPASDFELKDKVKNAFDASEQLVLELDLDNPSLQMDIMQHAAMKDGQTLDKLLTAEQFTAIDSQIQQTLGVGLQLFNTFKPLLISSFLTAKFIGEQPASFETELMKLAQVKEIEVLGLETVGEQMAFFDGIPYEDQVESLMEMVEEEEKIKETFSELVSLYKSEDHLALYKMMGKYIDDPDQIEVLIHKRNNNWIPQIGALAKEKATFIGVGAGHLGGEQGVLKLLQKAGYTLTPIM